VKLRSHCPSCEAAFNGSEPTAIEGRSAVGRCPSCRALVFHAGEGPAVLVGHDSEAMCLEIGRVLQDETLAPVCAHSGDRVWELQARGRFPAMVLDVALGGLSTFLVIERVRRSEDLADTKIVLLASVFNRTAYKRQPTSLYGADDYVEQHHIPDMLPAKLGALLGLPGPVHRQDLRAAAARIDAAHQRDDLRGHMRVRALAHAVVADIALYHEEELREALAAGEPGPLGKALTEGRREEYPSPDPVMDAFTLLLQRVRTDGE
jgi:DNA-binding response OmpR family regulator